MKRIVVFVLAAATLTCTAAQANGASSAGPTAAQFRALQKQVKALQLQVKTLQKWVPTSCSTKTCLTLPDVSGLADFTYTVNICQDAVMADQFQATWTVIDQFSAAVQAGKTYFGAQTPIADKSACSLVRVTRPTITTPPTAAIFSSLVTLLTT
jgi:hypothetical protein